MQVALQNLPVILHYLIENLSFITIQEGKLAAADAEIEAHARVGRVLLPFSRGDA